MGNYKYKLAEQIKPKDVDPKFISRIEKIYGPMDLENDFFSDNLDIYYKTIDINPEGGVQHEVIKLASFGDTLQKLSQATKSLRALIKTKEAEDDEVILKITQDVKDVFNKYRTYIRKTYPEQYKTIKDTLEEISTTGGGTGAATFTPGTGMQYATPYAFSGKKKGKYADGGIYTKKFGYKLVPKKIKGSGLEVKQLFEDRSKEFQQRRIESFDMIEQQINDIYKMLSNAKNETSDYYSDNPSSTEVIYATDLILDYIKDIKDILKPE